MTTPSDTGGAPAPASASTAAAITSSAGLGDAIDIIVNGALAERRIVGAVVMIAIDGRLVCERASGWLDREAGRPMTIDTVFRFASLTKPIVTAAALALIDAGVIGIDDPVTRWLPSFQPKLADGSMPTITVRQLLTHTSGLSYGFLEPADGPYHRARISDGMDQTGLSMDENLRRISTVPLFNAPGERWRYSVGMDVLGAVMAAASKTSLAQVVRQRVTLPLAMDDSGFVLSRASSQADRLAVPYADGPDGAVKMGVEHVVPFAGLAGVSFAPDRLFDPMSFDCGGGGMVGSGPDMLKFLETIRGGGAPILSAQSTAAMLRNQIGDLPLDLVGPGWGFGFGGAVLADPAAAKTPQSVGTWRWGGVYGHTWFVDPARKMTVVSLTNTSIEGMAGRYPTELRDAIYRAL